MQAVDLVNEQEEIKIRKSEAKAHFDAIKKACLLQSTSSLTIGYHAHWLKKHNQFGVLGFASEDEARQAAGVGQSTWYDVIRIAGAFEGVEEKKFTAMKLTNAKALAELPESKRHDTEWLRSAEVDSIEKFAEKISVEMQDKARPSDTKEKPSVMKMSMPASRKEVIETSLKDYAQAIGVEDTGQALELLVVERTGGPTLIGAISKSAAILKEARQLKESELSAEEVIEKLYKAVDDVLIEISAAMEQVQNLDSE